MLAFHCALVACLTFAVSHRSLRATALSSSQFPGFETRCPARYGTGSIKWDHYINRQDIQPMWVADMDFKSPSCIRDALQSRLDHGVFGYSQPTPSVYASVRGYLRREYGWEVDDEAIVFLPGVVQGITTCILAFSEQGDAVASPTPVYPPILSTPKSHRRATLELPMVPPQGDGEPWTFDFEGMRRALAESAQEPKLLILCNPQNPTSRVLSPEELHEFLDIAEEFDLIICSDEIHCDLVLGQKAHKPISTLGDDAAARTVTLMSPSKTYNVPGLGIAFAVVPNPELRRSFKRASRGIVTQMPAMGYAGLEAAFRDGEPWRQELLSYLRSNRDHIQDRFAELPATCGMTLSTTLESTYLAWIDVSSLRLRDPVGFFEKEAHVGLTGDMGFGRMPGLSFVRLNFGCSTDVLDEAMQRMFAAAQRQTEATNFNYLLALSFRKQSP